MTQFSQKFGRENGKMKHGGQGNGQADKAYAVLHAFGKRTTMEISALAEFVRNLDRSARLPGGKPGSRVEVVPGVVLTRDQRGIRVNLGKSAAIAPPFVFDAIISFIGEGDPVAHGLLAARNGLRRSDKRRKAKKSRNTYFA